MLLCTSGAILVGNLWTGEDVVRSGEGKVRPGQ